MFKKIALSLVIAFSALSSFAESKCPQFYPNKTVIEVPNTVELCSSFFVTRYDNINKAVIFSSELIKAGAPVGSINRKASFKADPALRGSPKPAIYANSGYDRGHMAPSDDASTEAEMADTFKMTNISPQEPSLNGGAWKVLENSVRKEFAQSTKDGWVITIAVYNGSGKMKNIPIPSEYWKITYGNTVKFYRADNLPYAKVVTANSANIEKIIKLGRKYE